MSNKGRGNFRNNGRGNKRNPPPGSVTTRYGTITKEEFERNKREEEEGRASGRIIFYGSSTEASPIYSPPRNPAGAFRSVEEWRNNVPRNEDADQRPNNPAGNRGRGGYGYGSNLGRGGLPSDSSLSVDPGINQPENRGLHSRDSPRPAEDSVETEMTEKEKQEKLMRIQEAMMDDLGMPSTRRHQQRPQTPPERTNSNSPSIFPILSYSQAPLHPIMRESLQQTEPERIMAAQRGIERNLETIRRMGENQKRGDGTSLEKGKGR